MVVPGREPFLGQLEQEETGCCGLEPWRLGATLYVGHAVCVLTASGNPTAELPSGLCPASWSHHQYEGCAPARRLWSESPLQVSNVPLTSFFSPLSTMPVAPLKYRKLVSYYSRHSPSCSRC